MEISESILKQAMKCGYEGNSDAFEIIDWFADNYNIHLKIDKAHFYEKYGKHYAIEVYILVEDGTESHSTPNYKKEGYSFSTAGDRDYKSALISGLYLIISLATNHGKRN